MSSHRTVYQPIHPSIEAQLDPEYLKFHNEVLQYIKPSEQTQWSSASRDEPSPFAYGGQQLSPVGSQIDHEVGDFQIRVFSPEGPVPDAGWPVLVWFHGGGFVMGGLGSENGFLTHVCHYVKCVVATVIYRHAPEFKHPTAFVDSYDGLQWVLDHASQLHIDTSKVALGGLSAGGCICAVTTLKAVSRGLQPLLQLLICPVLDNTGTMETTWSTSRHSPWLTPSRMTWYRDLYFSSPEEAQTWDASPLFAPKEMLALCPPTFMAIAQCDLLRPEAQEFSKKMTTAGVDVRSRTYPGATHSVLVLAGIHKMGQQLVHDACSALAEAFGDNYDPFASPIVGVRPEQ